MITLCMASLYYPWYGGATSLLNATKLSASDTALLREHLIVKKIDELRKIMSSLSVRLAPPVRRKLSIGLLEWHI